MSRLSMVERDELPEDERRFHDAVSAIRRRPISGPFIVLMNSSADLAARFAHLGHYFHARGQADESILSLRVRTFVALIGSRALDVPYEWGAWVGWALDAGVPHDTIDAIREGRPLQDATPEERLVLDFCTQLMGVPHRVNDATYRAALDHFGVQGVVELVTTLGYFAMIAFPLNAFEIEMSPQQKSLRKPYAPLVVPPHSEERHARREMLPLAHGKNEAVNSRIPLVVRHADLKPEHQHYFDRIVLTRGHVAPVFQALLNTPDVADRVARVGAFLLYESVVPPRVKSLVWLATARELDCEYEWVAGVHEARKAALPQQAIDAIASGADATGLSAGNEDVIAFCRELMRGNHHVSEPTYRAVVARFGVPAAVQIVACLGYFAMMAFVSNAFELQPDVDDFRPAM